MEFYRISYDRCWLIKIIYGKVWGDRELGNDEIWIFFTQENIKNIKKIHFESRDIKKSLLEGISDNFELNRGFPRKDHKIILHAISKYFGFKQIN